MLERRRSTLVDPADGLDGVVQWAYEATMTTLAIAVIGLLTTESVGWVHVVNVVVWAVFAVDYLVRLALSAHRGQFVRQQWPDLVSILPADLFRAARAFRLLRLLRAGRMLWRTSSVLRGVLDTNGLSSVLAVAAGVVVLGGFGVWLVEPGMGTLGDGIWWVIVTATTVGYGDLSPVSPVGRGLAVILMIVGIGTIGMITGSVATYFIDDSRQKLPEHVAFVHRELERWQDLSGEDRRRLAGMLVSLSNEESA